MDAFAFSFAILPGLCAYLVTAASMLDPVPGETGLPAMAWHVCEFTLSVAWTVGLGHGVCFSEIVSCILIEIVPRHVKPTKV